jgi:hypothetical protein
VGPERDRPGAVLGLLGVAGNVLGVAALWEVPGAYRPDALAAWAEGSLAHPQATVVSAAAFTIGLLALAGWGGAVGRALLAPAGPAGRLAGSAMAAGALVNAAGTLAPAVLVLHVAPGCAAAEACLPVARALLGATLSLDALFNLAFGAGLLLAGALLLRSGRRGLGALGLAAGLVTVPVAGQLASAAAARALALAGPLWLAFVVATSVRLWAGRAGEAGR